MTVDGEAQPTRGRPRQEAAGRPAGREESPGPKDEPEEARWVIEQIQQSFR
ncbi:MAG: hypothetical protein HY334_00150 [Armatimonadetes bacterium]|nr:hypothetical protein [Armatimonadota bacterium]